MNLPLLYFNCKKFVLQYIIPKLMTRRSLTAETTYTSPENIMGIYLITGAKGFIGWPLCLYLAKQGLSVRGTVRSNTASQNSEIELCSSGNIGADTDWKDALVGVEVIFHLAGTVHRPDITDPQIYRNSILQGTVSLAQQAISAGVKRFVYVSTSHVYGVEESDIFIKESHSKNPLTPYGAAKLAAEHELQKLAAKSDMEIVIIRPPLVYGAGVKGNFRHLITWVQKFPILPFGKAIQPRSFIGLDNFLSFLYVSAHHTDAPNKIFNVSDNQDVSTKRLCELFSTIMDKKCILLPIPTSFLHLCLKILDKEALYNKLFGSVRLDVNLAKNVLNWEPPFTPEEQVKKMFLSDAL
jgi:nucleoside-diphosphate-sugar epimerase